MGNNSIILTIDEGESHISKEKIGELFVNQIQSTETEIFVQNIYICFHISYLLSFISNRFGKNHMSKKSCTFLDSNSIHKNGQYFLDKNMYDSFHACIN